MSDPLHNPGEPARLRTHAGSILVLAIMLAAAWLLWSGFFKPLLLGLGAFSCLLVLIIAQRMHLFDQNVFALRLSLRLFRFWAWLAGEIVRSSLEVSRVVLSPRLPISPTLVEIESGSDHPVDLAILGNSITLTPGTLTLNIEGQRLYVHALTRHGAEALAEGEMNRRVSALRSG
jgi:multicomponent Na+:H+ antiporter subunit E